MSSSLSCRAWSINLVTFGLSYPKSLNAPSGVRPQTAHASGSAMSMYPVPANMSYSFFSSGSNATARAWFDGSATTLIGIPTCSAWDSM